LATDPTGPPIEVQAQRTDRFVFRNVVAGRRLADLVVRVRSTLTAPLGGEYVFAINCAGAGTLRIGGDTVLEHGAEHDLDWSYLFRPESRGLARVPLEGRKRVPFELDYRMTPGPAGEIGRAPRRRSPRTRSSGRSGAPRATSG
jgi:hypothetical protein